MPSAPLLLDPETLKDAIPPTYLERGRRYLQERRVLGADHDAERGLVTGRVRGSGGRVYQCIVQLGERADGVLTVVGQCSCPVGYNCKHVAAVLLSLGTRATRRPCLPRGVRCRFS
jgi:uncharacterized Zn finger protein